MATILVQPTSKIEVDDKAGNSFIIMTIQHTTATDSHIIVPDCAVSVAELPPTNGAAPTFAQSASGNDIAAVNPGGSEILIHNTVSGASGAGFTFATNDGVKQVIMDNAAASGTYTIVVRCIGSPAGSGSTAGL